MSRLLYQMNPNKFRSTEYLKVSGVDGYPSRVTMTFVNPTPPP